MSTPRRAANRAADLAAEIEDLRDQFQQIAIEHPWISLSIPAPADGPIAQLFTGVAYSLPGPNWPGVRMPRHPAFRAVTNHVDALTQRAHELLLRVLAGPNGISADRQQAIRAFDRKSYGYGWVCWLWDATPMEHPSRCENYAQVAATALEELKRVVSRPVPTAQARRAGRPPDPEIDPKVDKKLCEDWQAAKRQGTSRDSFCRTRGIDLPDLIAAQDRERDRRNRRSRLAE
jgi:hypothetical protein